MADLPEREHRCFSLTNEAGEVDAVVHGDPNMSPEALAALNEVVAAAKRRFEADLAADSSIADRQAAARARNHARWERLARERRVRRLAHAHHALAVACWLGVGVLFVSGAGWWSLAALVPAVLSASAMTVWIVGRKLRGGQR